MPTGRPGPLPYLVLLGGISVAAAASIAIRLAQGLGIPSTTIAAGRLLLAALILLPIVLLRGRAELRSLTRRDTLLGMASGLFLAAHFAAWISSLAYTSVASSVALVSTNPLWVGLVSLLVLRERLAPATLLGIALTIAGSALIGISDSGGGSGSNPTLGNGLALLGAAAGSGYFLLGRDLRRRLSILAYIFLAYGTAALALAALALALGPGDVGAIARTTTFAGLAVPGWALLLALAIGPQLLGHTAFNWSLRYLSATFVTVALLGEPIGSALLALLLFNESFQPLQLAGFVLLLAGIAAAARAESAASRAPTPVLERQGGQGAL
jgi:drug/metabolite transporter (DMT)-like permease